MIGSETQDAVRRYYEALHGPSTDILDAFNTGREEFIHDDIEWIWMLPPKGQDLPGGDAPGGVTWGTFLGADSVYEGFLKPHTVIMDVLSYTVEHCFSARGSEVCVVGKNKVHLTAGGPVFEGLFVHVWEFADGRATRFTAYAEDAVFQRGLGLDPDAPISEVMAAATAWDG
jgi:ketosteroid isomerase-like protein